MNEERFVSGLQRAFPFSFGTGIGDDASVVKSGRGLQLVTTDLLVEGVHFRPADLPPALLAQKALAVNLSDIAAMGGLPQYFYLGLACPGRWRQRELRLFFLGLAAGCRRWRVELAGGDFSRADKLVIAITVVGSARRPIFRSGAQPGDLIGISGPVGESALGLKLLLEGTRRGYFVRRHLQVEPELEKGRRLATYASSMIDVSDGLVKDLGRILDASRRGAVIEVERLPLSPRLAAACRKRGWNPLPLMLSGGEDYVLLFTLSPRQERRLEATGLAYHLIGRVTGGRRLLIRYGGDPLRLDRDGYDHFQEGRSA